MDTEYRQSVTPIYPMGIGRVDYARKLPEQQHYKEKEDLT